MDPLSIAASVVSTLYKDMVTEEVDVYAVVTDQDHYDVRGGRQGAVRLVLQIQRCTKNHDRNLIRDDCGQRLPVPDRGHHLLKTGY
jgi:hypothetical protein